MENIIYGVLGTICICMVVFAAGALIGLGKEGFDWLTQTKRFRWLSNVSLALFSRRSQQFRLVAAPLGAPEKVTEHLGEPRNKPAEEQIHHLA